MDSKRDVNIMIVRNFNSVLSRVDHPNRKSIRITGHNGILNHMDLQTFYRAFHQEQENIRSS